MKKRIVSILLTLCMVLMLCPVTALADEPPCIRGDIDFDGGYRNGKRIVFSSDGLIYYTADHYQSFDEIEVIWTDTEDSFLSGEDLKSFVKWLFEE